MARQKMRKSKLRSCMKCGSRRLETRRWFDGPVTYEHDSADSVLCLECGFVGVPLVFESDEERNKFIKALKEEGD